MEHLELAGSLDSLGSSDWLHRRGFALHRRGSIVAGVVESSVGSACRSTARAWNHAERFVQAALDSPRALVAYKSKHG